MTYVQVAADGSMELVINAFKTDGHTAADNYDPANGDFVLGLDTTLRIPLVPNATLTKFGFAPEVLGTLLGVYRHAIQVVFGDRNEKEFLFFNYSDRNNVTPIKADALGKRVGRRLKALTGKSPRTLIVWICMLVGENRLRDVHTRFPECIGHCGPFAAHHTCNRYTTLNVCSANLLKMTHNHGCLNSGSSQFLPVFLLHLCSSCSVHLRTTFIHMKQVMVFIFRVCTIGQDVWLTSIPTSAAASAIALSFISPLSH